MSGRVLRCCFALGVALSLAGCAGSTEEVEPGLRVYSLTDNPAINQAISRYESDNPEVDVELIVGRAEGADVSFDDALRSLNALLVSDQPPDVVVLDGLPVETLSRQGMLRDLSPDFGTILGKGEYFDNIVGASADGSCFYLPSQFTLPAVAGEASLVQQAKTVAGLRALLEDGVVSRDGLAAGCSLNDVYLACYPAIVRDGEIEREHLEMFFEVARLVCDGVVLSSEETVPAEGARSFSSGTFSTCDLFLSPGCVLQIAPLESWADFGNAYLNLAHMPATGDFALLADEAPVFVPNTMLAIASTAQHEEEAVGFLSDIFSVEAQKAIQGRGLPVSKTALQENLAENEGFGIGFMGEDGRVEEYRVDSLTADQIAAATALIAQAEVGVYTNGYIDEAIGKSCEAYLRDEVGLDQAIDQVVQSCDLYLAQNR